LAERQQHGEHDANQEAWNWSAAELSTSPSSTAHQKSGPFPPPALVIGDEPENTIKDRRRKSRCAALGGDLLQGAIQSLCRPCHDGPERELERLFKFGKCSAAGLRMDSKFGVELARRKPPKRSRGWGLDGWPLDNC
jgi:hypothetical protein